MNLNQIKQATLAGQQVYHGSPCYVVVHDSKDQWLIVCTLNNYTIGLTWQDGVTMNGKPEEFFMQPMIAVQGDYFPVKKHNGATFGTQALYKQYVKHRMINNLIDINHYFDDEVFHANTAEQLFAIYDNYEPAT